jgi:hypothetical protein
MITKARVAPGSCTVEYKQLETCTALFSSAQANLPDTKTIQEDMAKLRFAQGFATPVQNCTFFFNINFIVFNIFTKILNFAKLSRSLKSSLA